MKKLSLLLVLILLPSVFAISIDSKETYSPKETFIAEISGNILSPIQNEQVELKRNNVQVPWDYETKRLGDKYFIYGVLPNKENLYTLHIKDITTTLNGRVETLDFTHNITTQGELVAYSVKPGFALTKDKASFEVFLHRDFEELITISYPEETEFTLDPGQNNIELSFLGTEPGLTTVQIGLYSVPVFVLEDQTETIILPPLRFLPREIESTILIDENPVFPFSIINSGEESLTEVVLEFDSDLIVLEPEIIEIIEPGQTVDLDLKLRNLNTPIEDKIILRSGDFIIEMPVNVGYTENPEQTNTPYLEEDFSEVLNYYCAELDGSACSAGEICLGEIVSSLDSPSCCIGSCSEVSTESNSSLAVWGWLIGLVVIIIIFIVGVRYLKTKKRKPDPLNEQIKKVQKDKKIRPDRVPY